MMQTASGLRGPMPAWFIAIAGLLLAWSCSDILNDPAPSGDLRPLALRLISAPAPGGPNPSIGEAFAKADAARVRVQRAEASDGGTVLDTVVAFVRGENEARLRVTLDPTVVAEPLLVHVQILGGGAVLFEGSTTVTLEGSGTTSAEVAIEPVVARVDAGDDPPPLTAIGATLQLTGDALFATGDVVTGRELTWQALDQGIVEVSPGGQVVAVANGEARVEAAHAGLTDTLVVRVAQAIASIVVAPASVRLEPGESQQFTANAEDANGNPAPDPAIVWGSSDPEVATVDQTGLARAVAVGSATISASVGEASGSATVAVENPGPVLNAIVPGGAVAGDGALTLTASGSGFVGASEVHWNGAARPTEFVSATELRANIPAADLAADGSAAVTVVNPAPGGGESAARTFTIVPAVASVSVTPSPVTLLVGESQQFAAEVLDGNGDPAEEPAIVWSSSDPEVITVDAVSGIAQAVGAGSATVSATVGEVSGSAAASVENREPVLAAIEPDSAVAGDGALTLTASGSGFVAASEVHWNGSARPTEYVSGTVLRASIPASDLAAEGSAQITVVNPAPGGGESAAQTFTVAAAPELVLDPLSIDFLTTRGGGDPEPQTVSVSNGGSGSLGTVSFEIAYRSGSGWLRIAPTTVTAPGTFTLTTAVGQLAPGVYEADVSFAASSPSISQVVLPVTLTIQETVPAPPSQLAVARIGVDVDLRWLDNSDNEAAFAIERAIGETAFAQIATVAANQTTFSDPGVEWGQIYRYRVRAVNSAGASAPSNVVDVVVQDPPSADTQDPQNVTYGSATLRGAVSGNGLAYNYRFGWYSNDLEYSDSTAWTGSGACDPALECIWQAPLGNLYGARSYFYWIEAENTLGTVVGDTVTFRTLPAIPPAVQSDSATVYIPNSARMYFTVSPNGDDFWSWVELSFTEEFREPIRISEESFSFLRDRLGTTDRWEISAEIVDLQSGTTYYWRPMLRTFNQTFVVGEVRSFTTSGSPPEANRIPAEGVSTSHGEGLLAAAHVAGSPPGRNAR